MTAIARNPSPCGVFLPGVFDFYFDSVPDTRPSRFVPRVASIYPVAASPDLDSYPDWSVPVPASGDGQKFQNKEVNTSICPSGVTDSEIVCVYCSSTGVGQLWDFNTTTQGLSEVGGSANIGFAFNSDGNPGGSIQFSTVTNNKNYTQSEKARTSGTTWESWGVPPGSTVTDAEIITYDRRVAAATDKLTSHTISARIVDGAGTSVLSANLIATDSLPTTAEGSFVTVSGDGSQGVLSGSQPSNSAVRFELEYTLTLNNNSGNPAEQTRFDNILLLIYYNGGTSLGMLKVNAESQDVEWIVTDADWSPDPPMGAVAMTRFVETTITSGYSWSGAAPYSGGIVKYLWNGNFGETQKWSITSAGTKSYRYENVYINSPIGTDYTYNDGGPVWEPLDGSRVLVPVLSHAQPVGLAQNYNIGVGVKYTNRETLPPNSSPWPTGLDWAPCGNYAIKAISFAATSEVHVGPISQDADGWFYVSGSVWSKTIDPYHFQSNPSGSLNPGCIYVRIEGFDANPATSIIVMEYNFQTEFYSRNSCTDDNGECCLNGGIDYFLAGGSETWKQVLIGSSKVLERLIARQGTDPFNDSAFHPFWFSPRTLHTTEGGGQRNIVFERIPWDQTEANADFRGGTGHVQHKLKCYLGGSLDHEFTSRYGFCTPAALNVTFTNPSAVLSFAPVAGGDADNTPGPSPGTASFTCTVVQRTGSDSERADYNLGSRTLTVKIDIAAGHDTFADLRAIINAAGDFSVTDPTHDATVITTSTSGTGTLVDTVNAEFFGTDPTVYTSSDRYYYLENFKMRAEQLQQVDGVNRLVRSYHTQWQISHDGTITNPTGVGVHYADRGGTTFLGDSVKNSALVPLTPEVKQY